MAGKSFDMFRFRFKAETFSVLSAVFLFGRARLFCASRLALYHLAVWLVLGSLIDFRECTFIANINGNSNEYNGCVSIGYNSFFISLPLFTKDHKLKQHRKIATSCIFELSYIFYLGYF